MCPCTVEDCEQRGICCLCVQSHVSKGQKPACMRDVERPADTRSLRGTATGKCDRYNENLDFCPCDYHLSRQRLHEGLMTARRHDRYENPLAERYASARMSENFSPQRRYGLWRRLWLALAEAQRELGLPVTKRQLSQMRAHLDDIDFAAVAR